MAVPFSHRPRRLRRSLDNHSGFGGHGPQVFLGCLHRLSVSPGIRQSVFVQQVVFLKQIDDDAFQFILIWCSSVNSISTIPTISASGARIAYSPGLTALTNSSWNSPGSSRADALNAQLNFCCFKIGNSSL
jgi:hypothetical protein